jgi:dUTP pyrophosphatase
MYRKPSTTVDVKIVKDHSDARIPEYAYHGDAGMDLCSVEDTELLPNSRKLINTGIKIAIPFGYEGQVRPRSGLAIKYGITVLNSPGTIDSNYRGLCKVILYNTGSDTFVVSKGDRIAQLVILKCERAHLMEVKTLDETERAEGGFGSTGLS